MEAIADIRFDDNFYWNDARDTVFRNFRIFNGEKYEYSMQVHISMESLIDYDNSSARSGVELVKLAGSIWDAILFPIFMRKWKSGAFDKQSGILFILSEDVNG